MSADDLLYAPMNGGSPSVPVTPVFTQPDLKLPSSWLTVVDSLRNYHPQWADTALAGGCLRDLDLGRPVKDVDIFLPYGLADTGKQLSQCLSQYYTNLVVFEIKHDPNHNSALSNGVTVPSHFAFEIDGWQFEVTQKIEPFNHVTILDSFDLGICMICLDGHNVYRALEYQKDVTMNTMTVVRSTGGREVSHAKRLQTKYRNWKIVTP